MTKKDFILIASILAEGESVIHAAADSDTELTPESLFGFIRQRFEDELAKGHPRFNRGTFDLASRPIHNAELKKEILHSLGMEEK